MEYITLEQSNTTIDLSKRVKPYDNEKNNEILVKMKNQYPHAGTGNSLNFIKFLIIHWKL